jgi:hypothetical protein
VRCTPEWLQDQNGVTQHLINSQNSNVIVTVPPNMPQRMRDGIKNAIDRWNTAMNGYSTLVGPRLQYLETSTPCSGNFCINTQIGNVNLTTECADAVLLYDPSTGVITGSTITFPSQSATWPQNFNDRLAAHELGHHLGLQNNNTSCGTSHSVMRPVSCGQSFGYSNGPTTSDVWPVMESVYGTGTKSVCR